MSKELDLRHDGPIHLWFNLTYASYLVISRVLLQSMPVEWQARFVACLEEVRQAFPEEADATPNYAVFVRGDNGRLSVEREEMRNYRRNMLPFPIPTQKEK